MYFGRPVEKLQPPGGFLARATLERVIPRAEITSHHSGDLIATDQDLLEWVFIVLRGNCELRLPQSDKTAGSLETYKAGDTFGGGALPPERTTAEVHATGDCLTLRIHPDELEAIPGEENCVRSGEGLGTTGEEFRSGFADAKQGRVVTLAFLSDGLPREMLETQIARSLVAESGASVIALQLVAAAPAKPVDFTLNGKLPSLGILPSEEDGFSRLRLGFDNQSSIGRLGELLSLLRRRFAYVLVSVADSGLASAWLDESVCHSQLAYLFVRSGDEDLAQLIRRTRALRVRLNSHIPVELRPVLCLGDQEAAHECEVEAQAAGTPFHSIVRGCPRLWGGADAAPSRLCHSDLRRITRQICDRQIGLVLSSGGAKGYAHVGVFQVLEENGIEVDVVAGASMGAYIGALWAFGCDGAALEKLARDMEPRRALWSMIDPVLPPRRGFLRGLSVKQRLMQTIGKVSFSELTRSLRVVATNLNTLERVVFSSGEVASAVHASIAVPGICVPVNYGNETYVDGGIVDPLPVDVLYEMGIRRIIASNTIPTSESIRRRMQRASRHSAPASGKLLPLDQHLNYFAHGNILEILMNSIHGSQIRVTESACLRASIVLHPDIQHDHWMDFRNPRPYIAAGREATLRQLDEIKALVQQKGEPHEPLRVSNQLAAID